MANISQNVNIEMLEKLPDGTYKRKYPKTRSDTGATFDEHLADIVYSGSNDKTVRKIDANGNEVWKFEGHTSYVRSVAVDDKGYAYSGSSDKTVRKIG